MCPALPFQSVIDFVGLLEAIMHSVVGEFGIAAQVDSRNRGIWAGSRKIGSIGIAVKRGVAFHGLALNVNLDLNERVAKLRLDGHDVALDVLAGLFRLAPDLDVSGKGVPAALTMAQLLAE